MTSMQTFHVYPNPAAAYASVAVRDQCPLFNRIDHSNHHQSSFDDHYNVENNVYDCDENENEYAINESSVKRSGDKIERCAKRKKSGKSTYKHVPHSEKPPHLVARRNARERKRVQAVNSAFTRLRKALPVENRSKRLSKVKTLQRAIEHINNLMGLINQADDSQSANALLAASPVTFTSLSNSIQFTNFYFPDNSHTTSYGDSSFENSFY